MRSKTPRSHPAKMAMLPVAALWHPPETGQSTASAPLASTSAPRRRTSASSVVLISAPDASRPKAGEDSVLCLHDPRRCRRGRQARDHHLACTGHLSWALRPGGAVLEEGLCGITVEVPHHEFEPVALEATRQLASHIAQPDETDLHDGETPHRVHEILHRRQDRCRDDLTLAPLPARIPWTGAGADHDNGMRQERPREGPVSDERDIFWDERDLPGPTRDPVRLKRDMDRWGYCMIAEAVPADTLRVMRERLEELAETEAGMGDHVFSDRVNAADSNNQWVLMLINKDEVFLHAVDQPDTRPILEHVLGPEYLLSESSAHLTRARAIRRWRSTRTNGGCRQP